VRWHAAVDSAPKRSNLSSISARTSFPASSRSAGSAPLTVVAYSYSESRKSNETAQRGLTVGRGVVQWRYSVAKHASDSQGTGVGRVAGERLTGTVIR
jgi:hypothetical protein